MPSSAEWIAAGTPTEVPVTVETPVIPAADTVTAPDTTVNAPDTTVTAPDTTVNAPDTTVNAPEPVAPVAPAEFLEGRLGDQPFQIPKGVQIPWKRGTETGFVSLEEAQRGYMMERDYRQKTAQLAEQRRQMEIDARVQTARNEALRAAYEEQQARIKAAYDSPEEQARHEAFLTQYRNDPYFKKLVDEAQQGRVLAAENAAVSDYQTQEAQVEAAQQVHAAIVSMGAQYPDVDPDVVRQRYARALEFENAPLSQAAIESIYREEAARIQSARAPLATELEKLRAEIASIRNGQAAGAHNSTTRQQIERTVNPVAAPVGGTPPAPIPPAQNLTGRSLPDRSREWARLR